jgi:hypothetical protein
MWSPGMDGGATRRNWAILVGESAGEGVVKVEGLTIDRFVASERWGTLVDGRPAAPREPGRGAPAPAILRSWRGCGWCWEVVGTMWNYEEALDCSETS